MATIVRPAQTKGSVCPRLLYCVQALCVSLSDHLSVYLHTILKNHTAHACEGETLAIECPSRTSVAVLSAFYGRRVPSQHLCPSAGTNSTPVFSLQKVLSECQDKRSCHIPVLSPVFGQDPCPLTSKYLLVSYKCRPGTAHNAQLVCENERLRLMCKNETVLAIYSATFGHLLHGSPHCPQDLGPQTDMECLSPLALRKVSRRCHGRSNCSVLADTQTFGDPCFPGTRKHLRVSFTCGGSHPDVNCYDSLLHLTAFTGVLLHTADFDPSHLQVDGTLAPPTGLKTHFSLLGLPERVALYFVSGICAGLVFLLCLFGVRSTVVRDVKDLVSDLSEELKAARRNRNELMEDLYDDEVSDTSSFRRLTQSYRTTDILSPSTLAVEMVDCQGEQTRRDLRDWEQQTEQLRNAAGRGSHRLSSCLRHTLL
uniref:Si:ch73-335m24.2 n=1 Tax=Salarias fasciatus TaxID=181472 RepID=A0A672GM77_SALFA